MPKSFRLKRTAKKYQQAHGGRIVGTTGNYRVTKTKKRANPRGRTGSIYGHMVWATSDGREFKTKASALRHVRAYGGTVRKKREQFFDKSDYQARVPNLSVDAVGGWIKAKAVKIVKSGAKQLLLIKR